MGIFGKAIGSAIGGGLGSFIGKESDAARIGGEVGSWLPFADGGVVPAKRKLKKMAKGGVARPEQLQGMAGGGRVLRMQPKPYLNAMAMGGVVSDMQRDQFMTRTMPLGAAGRGRRRR